MIVGLFWPTFWLAADWSAKNTFFFERTHKNVIEFWMNMVELDEKYEVQFYVVWLKNTNDKRATNRFLC